jgi:hypothetical protein
VLRSNRGLLVVAALDDNDLTVREWEVVDGRRMLSLLSVASCGGDDVSDLPPLDDDVPPPPLLLLWLALLELNCGAAGGGESLLKCWLELLSSSPSSDPPSPLLFSSALRTMFSIRSSLLFSGLRIAKASLRKEIRDILTIVRKAVLKIEWVGGLLSSNRLDDWDDR